MSGRDDVEARLAALEHRLDAAESILAIQAMKAHYGAITDQRYTGDGFAPPQRLDAIAREVSELFTEDGVWDGGERLGRCVGRDAIYRRFLEPTLHFAWHLFVKPAITIAPDDPDSAAGTWDILAPCTDTRGRPYWMTGVEHDRYRRVGGAWLHSYMKLDLVFMAPYEKSWARGWRPADGR